MLEPESDIFAQKTPDTDAVFIKGYKVDLAKIQKICGIQPDDPRNKQILGLWRDFPIDFKYLGNGDEADGHVSLVMVFEEGCDIETLERKDIPSLDSPFDELFTQGIWVKH